MDECSTQNEDKALARHIEELEAKNNFLNKLIGKLRTELLAREKLISEWQEKGRTQEKDTPPDGQDPRHLLRQQQIILKRVSRERSVLKTENQLLRPRVQTLEEQIKQLESTRADLNHRVSTLVYETQRDAQVLNNEVMRLRAQSEHQEKVIKTLSSAKQEIEDLLAVQSKRNLDLEKLTAELEKKSTIERTLWIKQWASYEKNIRRLNEQIEQEKNASMKSRRNLKSEFNKCSLRFSLKKKEATANRSYLGAQLGQLGDHTIPDPK